MTHSPSLAFPGSEFDDFLFAPLGEDRNGMLLTVLSALARRGVDPWQEAAELALLPGEAATQRMVQWISQLADGLSPQPDPKTLASRLTALLPRRVRTKVVGHEAVVGIGTVTNAGVFVALVIFMAFTLGGQYLLVHHQPPGRLDGDQARASSTLDQKVPPQTAGE
jgi:hypothetical protein